MAETEKPSHITMSSRPEAMKHQRSFLAKFRARTHLEMVPERHTSSKSLLCPSITSESHSRLPSITGVRESLSDEQIEENFLKLFHVIVTHVREFYSAYAEKIPSQDSINHASSGIGIPWAQLLALLMDTHTRQGSLVLVISWTILSRCLLMKLGVTNNPGSTFLPPEIVECFQSFSVGKGALGFDEANPFKVDFALLSRWKVISGTLMHSTYVSESFSYFDSRTANIERALKDLDTLLTTYASPSRPNFERLLNLRDVLKQGADFAFVLFTQPSFWQFDWGTEGVDHKDLARAHKALAPGEVVIWPSLVRIMDGEGHKLGEAGERGVLGKKIYLDEVK